MQGNSSSATDSPRLNGNSTATGAAGEAPAANEAIAAATPAATGESDTPAAVRCFERAGRIIRCDGSGLQRSKSPVGRRRIAPSRRGSTTGEKETQETKKTWTLASLFAPKRREKPRAESTRAVRQARRKRLPQAMQDSRGSLPSPYVTARRQHETRFSAWIHEAHEADEDDAPRGSGEPLGPCRLTPSGPHPATEKVETGCFQTAASRHPEDGRRSLRPRKSWSPRASRASRSPQAPSPFIRAASGGTSQVRRQQWRAREFPAQRSGRGGRRHLLPYQLPSISTSVPSATGNWRCRRRKADRRSLPVNKAHRDQQ